jgi:hypothetical protein
LVRGETLPRPTPSLTGRLLKTFRPELGKGFTDATSAPAKGGGEGVGLTRKGKATKIRLAVDAQGIPLGVSLAGAVSSEPQMVQATMEFMDKETYTEKLVGDKAYDCAALCMCFTLLVR